jgi:hypothetical protein
VPVSGDPLFQLILPYGACVADAKTAIAARCGIRAMHASLFTVNQSISTLALTSAGSLRDNSLLSSICIALGEENRSSQGDMELFLVVQTLGN